MGKINYAISEMTHGHKFNNIKEERPFQVIGPSGRSLVQKPVEKLDLYGV